MNINGTNVGGPIRPFTDADKFPTAVMDEIQGGFHIINSLSTVDAELDLLRRQEGMIINIKGTTLFYEWVYNTDVNPILYWKQKAMIPTDYINSESTINAWHKTGYALCNFGADIYAPLSSSSFTLMTIHAGVNEGAPEYTEQIAFVSSTKKISSREYFNGSWTEWIDYSNGGSGDEVEWFVSSDTAPTDTFAGLEWLDTTSGIKYTWVIDNGEDNGQWVVLNTSVAAPGLELGDIKIGSRNLLLNTSNFKDLAHWETYGDGAGIGEHEIEIVDDVEYLHMKITNNPTAYMLFIQEVKALDKNSDYVLTMKYKLLSPINGKVFVISPDVTNIESANITPSTEFQTLKYEFNTGPGSNITNIRFDLYGAEGTTTELFFTDIMLENGNVPTAHTPAPEDIDEAIALKEDIGIAAGLIENLKDGVSDFGNTLKKLYNLIQSKVSFPGFGTTGGTACVGNDARLSDSRVPIAHTHPYLPLAGGSLTGDLTTTGDLNAYQFNGSGSGLTGVIKSLTTTGITGAATLNNSTGVLNIPTPKVGWGGPVMLTSTPGINHNGNTQVYCDYIYVGSMTHLNAHCTAYSISAGSCSMTITLPHKITALYPEVIAKDITTWGYIPSKAEMKDNYTKVEISFICANPNSGVSLQIMISGQNIL